MNFNPEELPTINRGTVIVIPKQPFYDWLSKLDPDQLLDADDPMEYTSYLITEELDPFDLDETIKGYYQTIFENELYAVWDEESDWPEKRDFKLFKKWFDCKVASLTFDLEKMPLKRDL